MNWLLLTPETLQPKVNGPELGALRAAALRGGQPDPLQEILSEVILEIRGHVAAGGFGLGPADTLPENLLGAALALIRYRLYTRLPGARSITDARWHDNEDALMLLRQVARGHFQISEDTPAGPLMTARADWFSREEQEGI